MSQVPLRDYLERMRARLSEGQYADVVTLGQHVLRYYPKHLETYRLLAEARLETNDPNAAVDLFQRVRSADPENIVALVGLSLVHEQRKELQEAIWHLERAFEIQPANMDLRQELLRLYAEYEGTPRERLKLTPGGLARLYTRQGLYSQAIQEFRGLLQRDPTRADVQAALAETLYRVGRKQEAAEVAQALLEKLPYCLKANLLLGSLWAENGVPEAEALLQRARSMDPENSVARELIPDHWDDAPAPMLPAISEEATSQAGPVTAPVPQYDESAGRDMLLLDSLAPRLLPKSEMAIKPPAPAETAPQAVPTAEAEPLAPVLPELPPAPGAADQSAAEAPPIPQVQEEPEQFKPPVEAVPQPPAAAIAPAAALEETAASGAQVELAPPAAAAEESKPARRLKPSLPRIGPTIPGAMDKLPAWLHGTAPSTIPTTRSTWTTSGRESTSPLADRLSAMRTRRTEKAPAESQGQPPVTHTPQGGKEQISELPDWLTRARQAARSGESEENIAATGALEERPAWLAEAAEESPSEGGAAPGPDWLRTDSTGTPSEPTRGEPEGSLPAWLSASEPEAQVEAPPSSAALPDWLSAPLEQERPVEAEVRPPVPEWLKSGEPEAPPDEEQAPAAPSSESSEFPMAAESRPPTELPKAEAGTSVREPGLVVQPAPILETDESIPEWLRELSAATEAEPAPQTQPLEAVSAALPATEPAQTKPEEPVSPVPPAAAIEPAVSPLAETEPVEPVVPAAAAKSETVQPPSPISVPEAPSSSQVQEEPEAQSEPLLAQAHELWRGGDQTGAIESYEQVLKQGNTFTNQVIADFEQFVQDPNVPMPAHRLLGDAYSMVGRFKEALEQYRIVLGR